MFTAAVTELGKSDHRQHPRPAGTGRTSSEKVDLAIAVIGHRAIRKMIQIESIPDPKKLVRL
jgi:hypothetical protein